MKNLKLVCKKVKFYFEKDEAAFFEWIEKIKCINHTSAAGDELYLHIKEKEIADDNLRDLIGLFCRYKIDMKQLQIFLNESNKEWFYGRPKGFWHKRIWD
jgi:hypothetical protein